jgi:ribosome-binding factor A
MEKEMSSFRLERLQNQIRQEISALIMTGKIKDPRVTNLASITRVQVSRDLSHAKIWVSGFENAKTIEHCVDALNHAHGFIQSFLGKKLHVRNTPKLQFIHDRSIEEGFALNKKIDRLNPHKEDEVQDE